MKKATCVYCVNEATNQVLMAWQQKKIVGLKGYGGVFDPDAGDITMEDCAVREFKEESGLDIFPEHLELFARVVFYNGTVEEVPEENPSFEVWFYRYRHPLQGTPVSTPEMQNPDWFPMGEALPLADMIQGDEYFIPSVLAGTPTSGRIRRTSDWKKILEKQFECCTPQDLAA
ncbi:MAG TPA: NUDIX domain-containing protein [Candidatus Paceibacterota bacterium]|nr:NUDIX domain-containing protein [Candidatus Paceibacterota bacterium]